MRSLVESFGWRSEPDPSGPIASPDQERRLREIALRYALAALSRRSVASFIHGVFERRRVAADDSHARLVRFASLADELVESVIPRLRSAVRCQARTESRWMAAPSGGRVDPIATERLAIARGPGAPREWLVRRSQRWADTPVNRLVAAIVRRTITLVRAAYRDTRAHWGAHAGEEPVLRRAIGALEELLAITPLGEVPVDPRVDPSALERDAAGRRAELVRVGAVVDWWRRLAELDLTGLRDECSRGAELVPVSGCYEAAVALSLLLALGETLALERVEPEADAIRFVGRGVGVTVRFGAIHQRLFDGARGHTALLEIERARGGRRRVLIEARNYGDSQSWAALAREMALWRLVDRDVGCLAVLPWDVTRPMPFSCVRFGIARTDGPKDPEFDEPVALWCAEISRLLAEIPQGT